MKLFALTSAAALVLATSASAMTTSQIGIEAQNTLDKFGFAVDAGDLTRVQWAGINAADNDSDRTVAEVRAAIASVLKH